MGGGLLHVGPFSLGGTVWAGLRWQVMCFGSVAAVWSHTRACQLERLYAQATVHSARLACS